MVLYTLNQGDYDLPALNALTKNINYLSNVVKRNENRVSSFSFLDVSVAIFRLYFKASTG